jgi:uncharacterized protein YjeT (DUF2065 family)
MNDAFLRLALTVIAAVTVASGLTQMIAPAFALHMVGGEASDVSAHLFRTVGMFMAITGAMFLQTLLSQSTERAVPLWIAVQKYAAAGLVGFAVVRGLFGALALGVAAFDLATAVLTTIFLVRIGK